MTKSLLAKLRKAYIISHEPVTLRNGEKSDYYADIKKACGDPALLAAMAQEIAKTLDKRTTCIAVSGYGGLPLGTAVSLQSGLPLALVRDAEKNHGKRGMIDGYVPGKNDAVSLIDDVFTSGSSLYRTAENLQPTGAKIAGCHVVVARGNVTDFDLPVSYLFTPDDLK